MLWKPIQALMGNQLRDSEPMAFISHTAAGSLVEERAQRLGRSWKGVQHKESCLLLVTDSGIFELSIAYFLFERRLLPEAGCGDPLSTSDALRAPRGHPIYFACQRSPAFHDLS